MRTCVRLFEIVAGIVGMMVWPAPAHAEDGYQSTIVSPTPFMGKNNEVFKLADGSVWQVKYEYEYLYEYYPTVVICPSRGVVALKGKSLTIIPLQPRRDVRPRAGAEQPANALVVVYRPRGCDYFVADGPQGYYILEWYGGYDPQVGDHLAGYESGYGMKDVLDLGSGSKGRVWVEDYLLSKSSAAEKIAGKCK